MSEVKDNQLGISADRLVLFRGDRCLLNDVAVHVRPGEGLVLRGANGAGKTTLLRVLCGLTQLEEGQVSWNGVSIYRQRESWNHAIGWSGHHAGLKSELTVLENLQFSAELDGRKLGEVPDELGLTECLNLPARVLSAGQQRRSSLARVLLSNSIVWFLDEPYTNLDNQGQSYLNTCIDSHLASGGLAIIASHGETHCSLGITELTLERGRLS